MLKLTYTETGFNLEYLAQSLEDWVAGRVILSLRIGKSICLQPSTASFLLPVDLPGMQLLETEARREGGDAIGLAVGDAEFMEVSLRGNWIAADVDGIEGIFVASMSDRMEFFIFKLWQEAQNCAATFP
jgi:hypothetical protein